MNPAALLLLVGKDRILRICALATGIIVLIPMLVVLTITQVGAQTVSNILLPPGQNTNSTTLTTVFGIIKLPERAIWPVGGVVTLEFGMPDPPYQLGHTGIDIANVYGKIGDPVRSILPGKVVFAGTEAVSGGKDVQIDHGSGLTSLYGHLNSYVVQSGDTVTQGQLIGYEGETGWATGPHVHLQIEFNHIPVNPRLLLGSGSPPRITP